MWFVLSMLAKRPTIKIYRILPLIKKKADTWKGFGIANAENLEQAYHSKIQLTAKDIDLGNNLWIAYQHGNTDQLQALSTTQSKCFEYLAEVCQAHIDRYPADKTLGRPDKVIKTIIETGLTAFEEVFLEFSEQEGIYGFGDLQVKTIYNRLIAKAFVI
jgi:hypothetical protein